MKISKRTVVSIIVNGILFLSVLITATIGIVFGAGDGQKGTAVIGLGYFKPFTMDSNVLAAFAALMVIIYSVKNARKGAVIFPKWVMNLNLMASACLSLTFIIAAFFLAPMSVMEGEGYFVMFSDDMFFFHLLNPILSVISFILIQNSILYKKRECIIGAIPTIIYSLVYLFMVVIVKKWDDFYNFTFGGKYWMIPFVFIVIYSIVIGASLILIVLHNRNLRDTGDGSV